MHKLPNNDWSYLTRRFHNSITLSANAESEGVEGVVGDWWNVGQKDKKNPLYKILSLTHPFLIISTAVTIVTHTPYIKMKMAQP